MIYIYPFLTIALFYGAQKLQHRFPLPFLNPVLLSLIALIAIILLTGGTFEEYNKYSHFISDLLDISVVALGVPLYHQFHSIHKALPKLLTIALISAIIAISSTILLSLIVGASNEIAISLAPKSVTTPIAVLISEKSGGIAALSAVAVLVTGISGAVFGEKMLALFKVTSDEAIGAAMGIASHALGTAQISRHNPKAGAYSAFTLVLSAIFSALLCPPIVRLILR